MTPTEHAEAILKAIDWATLGAYRPEPFPALLAAVEAAMQDARVEERGKIVEWLTSEASARLEKRGHVMSGGGPEYDLGRATGYGHAAHQIKALAHKGVGDA